MARQTLYDFLLDFFPLTDLVFIENPVLGAQLQSVALDALISIPEQRSWKVEQLALLLRLSHDLGYVDDEVASYLERGLRRIDDVDDL